MGVRSVAADDHGALARGHCAACGALAEQTGFPLDRTFATHLVRARHARAHLVHRDFTLSLAVVRADSPAMDDDARAGARLGAPREPHVPYRARLFTADLIIVGALGHAFALEYRYFEREIPRSASGKYEEFVSLV
jgi:hypothetical protein